MTITLPVIASKKSFPVDVKAGQKYFWCSCGLSKTQPFCDGAHKAFKDEDGKSIMKSVMFEATKDEAISFCGCKHSKNGVFCDNSHKDLS